MAHKKGVGSSKNGRESESKRLGVKIFGGQAAIAGNIIIRQRGTKHHPGDNVGIGKDHTLYALTDGLVAFKKKANNRSFVSIIPFEEDVVLEAKKAPAKKAPKAAPVSEAPKTEEAVKETTAPEVKAPKAEKKAAAKTKATDKPDKLNKIEGVGPKLASVLVDGGLATFAAVAAASVADIQKILDEAEGNYARFSPDTWPQQAKLATEGKWDELKELQDNLDGGKAK